MPIAEAVGLRLLHNQELTGSAFMSASWDHDAATGRKGLRPASHEDFLGFVHARREIGSSAKVWMKLFHQLPMRPRDVGGARAFFQPENFIGFIFRHRGGAAAARRIARIEAPRVRVRIACRAPSGKPAIEISFQ